MDCILSWFIDQPIPVQSLTPHHKFFTFRQLACGLPNLYHFYHTQVVFLASLKFSPQTLVDKALRGFPINKVCCDSVNH